MQLGLRRTLVFLILGSAASLWAKPTRLGLSTEVLEGRMLLANGGDYVSQLQNVRSALNEIPVLQAEVQQLSGPAAVAQGAIDVAESQLNAAEATLAAAVKQLQTAQAMVGLAHAGLAASQNELATATNAIETFTPCAGWLSLAQGDLQRDSGSLSSDRVQAAALQALLNGQINQRSADLSTIAQDHQILLRLRSHPGYRHELTREIRVLRARVGPEANQIAAISGQLGNLQGVIQDDENRVGQDQSKVTLYQGQLQAVIDSNPTIQLDRQRIQNDLVNVANVQAVADAVIPGLEAAVASAQAAVAAAQANLANVEAQYSPAVNQYTSAVAAETAAQNGLNASLASLTAIANDPQFQNEQITRLDAAMLSQLPPPPHHVFLPDLAQLAAAIDADMSRLGFNYFDNVTIASASYDSHDPDRVRFTLTATLGSGVYTAVVTAEVHRQSDNQVTDTVTGSYQLLSGLVIPNEYP